MYHGFARPFALACLATSLGGCGTDAPLRPDASKASLAAGGAAGPDASSNNLTSTAVSKSQIDLSWQDDAAHETGWEVHRSTSGPAGAFTLLATTAANVTSYSDMGLDPLTQYCYRVRSFRTSGKKTSFGEFSSPNCSTTPGPPPASSNADARPANSTAVDVTWADNSGTEDGFSVERSLDGGASWATVATTVANVTSLQDGGRSSEQQVCYRVVAFNAHGDSGPSNADCTVPPAGPMSLAAAAVSPQAVDLTWTDNSLIEDGYKVERAPAEAGPYSAITTLAANSTSYRDRGLSGSTTYWYRVRATREGGFSDFSNSASATTPAGSCVDGPERVCDNGVDDDCDGVADSADPDCANCTESTEKDCGNFADDDCDGLVDGADPDCPAPACDYGCPPGMICYPDGFCYYPAPDSDCASGLCVNDVCQDPGGDA
jgi:hypothetical protein